MYQTPGAARRDYPVEGGGYDSETSDAVSETTMLTAHENAAQLREQDLSDAVVEQVSTVAAAVGLPAASLAAELAESNCDRLWGWLRQLQELVESGKVPGMSRERTAAIADRAEAVLALEGDARCLAVVRLRQSEPSVAEIERVGAVIMAITELPLKVAQVKVAEQVWPSPLSPNLKAAPKRWHRGRSDRVDHLFGVPSPLSHLQAAHHPVFCPRLKTARRLAVHLADRGTDAIGGGEV